jgi:hypothetical protein
MYCSSCGVSVAHGLSYCNYCGAKLNDKKADAVVKPAEVRPESLVFGMMATFIFGLGAITLLMGMMKAVLKLEPGLIIAITLLSFLIMLLIEGVFIRLLLRRHKVTEGGAEAAPSKGQETKELDGSQARALPEHMPSVTEHTTRTFEPIYSERKSE